MAKCKPAGYWRLRAWAAQIDDFDSWEVYRLFCKLHKIAPSR